jgi:hypothetical protein
VGAQVTFVCGVGRSGTTALTTLLNGHPRVCIGIERYKYLFVREQPVSAELFTKERFFDFKSEETNIWPSHNSYTEIFPYMYSKWDRARILGDKIPHLFAVLPHTFAAFPDAKIIYIVRNIEDVAASWVARAEKPDDQWSRGFDEAIRAWNRGNTLILRHAARAPESVLVVSYERLFGGSPGELLRLCRFLAIWPSGPMLRKYVSLVRYYRANILERADRMRPGWAETIAERADRKLQRQLLALR